MCLLVACRETACTEAMQMRHSGQITGLFRLRRLFHGVTGGASSNEGKLYPGRCGSERMLQPPDFSSNSEQGPFLESLSGDGSGGRRKWRRRTFRPSYKIPTDEFVFSSMNVQSLRFDQMDHRTKLHDLIVLLRKHSVHVCALQETKSHNNELQVFYVEEYCFVVRGRVAVAMINAFAQQWEQSGRQVLCREPDTVLSVILPFRDHSLLLTAVYTPQSRYVGDKRAHYTHCTMQHRQLVEMGCVQVWGGDFNGHIACGDGPSPHCGQYGLAMPPTTTGGKLLSEWLVSTKLAVADTFTRVPARGSWLHTQTKQWCELDWLLVDQDRLRQVLPRMKCVAGLADHRVKIMGLHLGDLVKHSQRKLRAKTWKHRFYAQPQDRKLNMESFRGNSSQAREVRQQFQAQVECVLQSCGVPEPPVSHVLIASHAAVEGWEETDSSVVHFYTDGSYTPAEAAVPAKCGAGVHMWLAQSSYDACRPIQVDGTHSRLSNNVAELDAIFIGFAMASQTQICG